jgi:hypothetical protein
MDRHPLTVLLRRIAPRRPVRMRHEMSLTICRLSNARRLLCPRAGCRSGSSKRHSRFAQVAAAQSCLPPRGILEPKPELRGNHFVNSV